MKHPELNNQISMMHEDDYQPTMTYNEDII